MVAELRPQRHRVDHHGLFRWVVVQDHDFQQTTGAIGGDDQVPIRAGDDTKRVAEGVQDVLVQNAVFARAVRDLHEDKVALSLPGVKVALSRTVSSDLRHLRHCLCR